VNDVLLSHLSFGRSLKKQADVLEGERHTRDRDWPVIIQRCVLHEWIGIHICCARDLQEQGGLSRVAQPTIVDGFD
tara:strand:- start:100 stop:327 length:228 start_codon:yes stop_codon:yes gene_type:complete